MFIDLALRFIKWVGAIHLATPYLLTIYNLKVVITAEKGDKPPLNSQYLIPANQ